MDAVNTIASDIYLTLKRRPLTWIERVIADHSLFYSCFKTHIVNFMFSKCHKLHQSPDTRYLAVELFNRYYMLSTIFTCKAMDLKESTLKSFDLSKINSNFILEMFVCILISSKFNESVHVLNNNIILKELLSTGTQHNLQEILKTEKSVVKKLNFEVFIPTLVTYVDMVLVKLELNEETSGMEMHETCCHIIDLAYIHHSEIYQKFNFLITREWEWSTERRFHFQPIENNRWLLGSAIVYTAISLQAPLPSEISEKLLTKLEEICDNHSNDIGALSRILCEICIL